MKRKPKPPFYFVVSGACRFPLDMLRYDDCFPTHERDTAHIARTLDGSALRDPTFDAGVRVKLTTYNSNAPTADRWKSFGWRVERVDVPRDEPSDQLEGGS